MDAIISGRAGKGLLIADEAFMSFDVESPNVFLPLHSLNLRLFFGGAFDLQVLKDTDAASASDSLIKAYGCTCALDLILIAFDPTLSEQVRFRAVEALEPLLVNGYVLEHLENVLYGRPLPPTADLDTLLELNRINSTPIVNSFIQTISVYQQAIREISLAWDAIPLSLFGSEEKRAEFQQVAIREGCFRTLVRRHSFRRNITLSRFNALLAPAVETLPNHEEILQRWAENLLISDSTFESKAEAEMPPAAIFEEGREGFNSSDNRYGQRYKSYPDDELDTDETGFARIRVTASIEKWREFPYSSISHHGGRCCDIAREWVMSIDFSQLSGASPLTGPRWLRQKYAWGPSPWPLHWCAAVERKTLDSGALASLAHEIFKARGVQSFPAQFIQQFTGEATCHWRQRWGGEEFSAHWIEDDLIYHEGCAVLTGADEIRLWDASAGWWVNPKQFGGYGSVVALKVFGTNQDTLTVFKWGTHLIVLNVWHDFVLFESDQRDKLEEDTDDYSWRPTSNSAKRHGES